MLEAVRPANHLRELSLGNQTVISGHSQGGHAALWTGVLAPYAPDVNVVGVAGLAPASDLIGLLSSSVDVDPSGARATAESWPRLGFLEAS